MLKKTIVVLGMLSVFAACQNDENPVSPKTRKDIVLTSAELDMTDVGTDFAFRFFNQVCNAEIEKPNLFVSPLSASLCLSMVANGANANTLEEMKSALGFSDYSVEAINNYNRKLVNALLDLDNTTRLGIANSIWIKQGFNVLPAFTAVNREMYDAEVREVDFASSATVDAINRWCAEKTNNCIKKVLDGIPEDAQMYLLNALYFKGTWKEPFKKADTKNEYFTDASGNKSTVPMMNLREEHFMYTQNDYFSIAELPYGNEAFSMVVLLPAEGKTLEDCLPQLTKKQWEEWSDALHSQTLNLKLPKFELEYNKRLEKDMEALGMKDAFQSLKADFSKISERSLFIGLLQQFAYINVNEEGTEAAAVTIGGLLDSAVGPETPVDFYVNRPFVFFIREKSTGTILFAGRVTKL